MFTLKNQVSVLLSIAMLFLGMMIPEHARADWDDNSGDLPGSSTTKTLLLVGVGAAALVLVIYLVSKSGKNEKKTPDENKPIENPSAPDSSQSYVPIQLELVGYGNTNNNTSNLSHFSKKLAVMPYLGLGNLSNTTPSFTESGSVLIRQAVIAGLTLRF
jgi:hypothetical protein